MYQSFDAYGNLGKHKMTRKLFIIDDFTHIIDFDLILTEIVQWILSWSRVSTQKTQFKFLICTYSVPILQGHIFIDTENLCESNKLKIGLKKPLFFLESTNDKNKGTII